MQSLILFLTLAQMAVASYSIKVSERFDKQHTVNSQFRLLMWKVRDVLMFAKLTRFTQVTEHERIQTVFEEVFEDMLKRMNIRLK